MIEHRSPISGIATFGGRYVATAGYDNQVILWDARTQRGLARVFHDHLANQCRFAPDGSYLVSASSDYTARLWSVPDLRLTAVLTGHDDDVEMAAPSPDGGRIATASRDYHVRTFDLQGRLLRTMHGHTADVISVEWSVDGRQLVSSSDDGTVRRWDADSGELREVVDLHGVESDTVVVDSTGVLFVGTDDGEIVTIAGAEVHKLPAHRSGIKRLVIDLPRRLLLSASYDRTIKIWSIGPQGALTLTHEADVPALTWLRTAAFLDEQHITFGSFGSSYVTYDLASRQWQTADAHDTPGLNAVCYAGGAQYTVGDAGVVWKDGTELTRLGSLCNFLVEFGGTILTGGQQGILFDAVSGESIYRHRSPLNCGTSFTSAGEPRLMVGTYTGEGLVFRVGTGGSIEYCTTVQLHDNAIKGLAASSDCIFSVCATGAAGYVGVDDLQNVREVPDAHDRIANGAAVLPDGRFVSVSRDRKLRIWGETGVEVIDTPHDHSIKCVAVNPASGLIATGSYYGLVAIYSPRDRAWATPERPTAAGISSLCAGDSPETFFASSYDGNVYRVTGSP
jgi:toxoflavin biosynthesis protein ToxC